MSARSDRRIRSISWYPFICGIARSASSTSGLLLSSDSSACSAESAVTTVAPVVSRIRRTGASVSRSSSTARIRNAHQLWHGDRGAGLLWPRVFGFADPGFLVHDPDRQLDPEGGTLSRAAAGHRNAATMQLHQMTRNREAETESAMGAADARVRLSRALEHVGKELLRNAAPVSLTAISTCDLTPSGRTCTRPPRFVNFTEFDKRFLRICCRRSGSPDPAGVRGSTIDSSWTLLASAAGRIVCTAASITAGSSTDCRSR